MLFKSNDSTYKLVILWISCKGWYIYLDYQYRYVWYTSLHPVHGWAALDHIIAITIWWGWYYRTLSMYNSHKIILLQIDQNQPIKAHNSPLVFYFKIKNTDLVFSYREHITSYNWSDILNNKTLSFDLIKQSVILQTFNAYN